MWIFILKAACGTIRLCLFLKRFGWAFSSAFIRPITLSFKLLLTSLAIMVFLSGHLDNLDVSHQDIFSFINTGLLRCVAEFFTGTLAFRSWRSIKQLALPLWAWSIIELGAVYLIYLLLFMRKEYHSEVDFFAPAIFYCAVVVFAMEKGALSRLLFNLRYPGLISYTIYLYHLPLMISIRYLDNRHGWFAGIVPTIFFFALIGFPPSPTI
jgi:peptidoglycan/LPS O-acetylase OafA/YrhL